MRMAEPSRRLAPLPVEVPAWAVAVAWLLAAVFLATGLGKALDVVGFALVLHDFRIFPDALLMPVALGVIGLEFAIAIGLTRARQRALAALAAGLLAIINALVLSFTLWRGIPLENCGCFGVFLARPLTLYSPLEDVVLLGLACLVRWRA